MMKDVFINDDDSFYRYAVNLGPNNELGNWCAENIPDEYAIHEFGGGSDSVIYLFTQEAAVAFKLMWS